MTPKEQFQEFCQHLYLDVNPSQYLKECSQCGKLRQSPFDMLELLQKTPQSPIHHPEGNAWNHMCLVVDQAAKLRTLSQNPQVFMWAALLHDIGKPQTTRERKGRIISYDHDKVGMELARKFLTMVCDDNDFIDKVSKLVRYHMHVMFVVKDLPFADINAMKRDVDVREVALLGFCDRMGRTKGDAQEEQAQIELFLKKLGAENDMDLSSYYQ